MRWEAIVEVPAPIQASIPGQAREGEAGNDQGEDCLGLGNQKLKKN